jgi:hypothetical protein
MPEQLPTRLVHLFQLLKAWGEQSNQIKATLSK